MKIPWAVTGLISKPSLTSFSEAGSDSSRPSLLQWLVGASTVAKATDYQELVDVKQILTGRNSLLRPVGVEDFWAGSEDEVTRAGYINPRSKVEETVRHTHQAAERHSQCTFTWASVPGQMASS